MRQPFIFVLRKPSPVRDGFLLSLLLLILLFILLFILP